MVKSIREEVLDKIVNSIPVKRHGNTEEIASIVNWLASDDSGFQQGLIFLLMGNSIWVKMF
jgi:acetoacetyl-CoA reductase